VAKKHSKVKTPPKTRTTRDAASSSIALIQSSLQTTIELHKQGNFSSAENGYLKILELNSNHFDALQLLGTLCAQTGRFKEGVVYLLKALKIQPNNVSVLNNLGYAYKEVKEFEQAIDCFNKSIKFKPDYAEAYNNRGNTYKDYNKIELAIESYEFSIIYSPQNAEAYYNRSQIFFESKDLIQSLRGYEQAIKINPYYLEAHTNMALILSQMGLYVESIESSNKALGLRENHPQALSNKGTALYALGRLSDSIECFKKAYYFAPYFVDPLVNMGNAFKDLLNLEYAFEAYTQAIIIDPSCTSAILNRAVVLNDLGQTKEALGEYDKVITLAPSQCEAFFNRANLYKGLKEYQRAISDYDVALKLVPSYAAAFNNRGNSWINLGERERSRVDYETSIELDPSYVDAYNNLGVFLHEEMDLDNALVQLTRASVLNSNLVDPLWNRSLILLTQGQFEIGFELFEYRWKNPRLGLTPDPANLGKPVWSGHEEIKNSSILLFNEQGLGDTIQFSRYATILSTLGAKVTLKVQPELFSLYKHSKPPFDIISTDAQFEEALGTTDYVCPLMSLALAHHKLLNHTEYAAHPPAFQFKVPNEATSYWEERISDEIIQNNQHANKQNHLNVEESGRSDHLKLRVGIAWSGNSKHLNDHNRSIPFETFAKCLPINNFYVNLQKEIRNNDLVNFEFTAKNRSGQFINTQNSIENFSDLSAILKCLDLVVTVDTSIAHLSGSLGIPTLLLLPFSPDWRWRSVGTTSEWYPSLSLYRQSKIGDWGSVMNDIYTYLSNVKSNRVYT